MEHNRFDYSPIIDRKPIQWPNGARVAIWIIPNIEHYEFDIPAIGLHASNVVPDVLNYAWRDYGPRVGVWRLMEVLDKYGFRGTVALHSAVCHLYPRIIEEAKKRNWEFMGHSITNSHRLSGGISEEEERRVIRETIQTITEAVGKAPEGWLGPGLEETFVTPDILAEEGIRYLCDWCNDDQPYPMKVKEGKLISLPYSVELNDIPFFLGHKGSSVDFMQAIKDQFDVLYEEGKTNGRVMAIAVHPYIINVPYRHKYLDMALEYIARHEDIWLTTGGEIARWYYDHYDPTP
ncbi:MAG: polysaccharide deacetylase family protein [Deltaproteobacteria bacterium]|nr:polysaccharide deacetylase family protein [Deltaproteobacteria bacterium]